MTIAQLLAVTQGILGLINGINGLRQTIDISGAFGQLGLSGLAGRVAIDMVGVIVLSLLVLAGAAIATRPSNIVRWLLVAWELAVILVTLLLLLPFPFSFALFFANDLTVVALLTTGVGIIHPLIVLTMAAIIVFGFGLYPPTWEAYGR